MSGHIQIQGKVLAACVRTTSGRTHTAVLCLQLDTGAGRPWQAKQECGHTNAEHAAAHAKARMLSPGSRVTVYALGGRPSGQYIDAIAVSAVIPADIPTTHHKD